jgi:hypothetical protein
MPHMLFELAKATLCQKCHQGQAQELSERMLGSFDDWRFQSERNTRSGAQLDGGSNGVSESGFNQHRPEVTGRGNFGRRGGGGSRGEHRQQAEPQRQREPRDNNKNDRARSGRGRRGRGRGCNRHEQARSEPDEQKQPEQSHRAAGEKHPFEKPKEPDLETEERRQGGEQDKAHREEDEREARQVLQEEDHRHAEQVRAEVRPELRAADKTRLAQEDESNRQAEQTKAQILTARAAAKRERREQEVRQHAEKRRRERELLANASRLILVLQRGVCKRILRLPVCFFRPQSDAEPRKGLASRSCHVAFRQCNRQRNPPRESEHGVGDRQWLRGGLQIDG